MQQTTKIEFKARLSEAILRVGVWGKGEEIPNYDPRIWRRDRYGNPIRFLDYGNRASTYGWEIDHIVPVARGGGEALTNKQPLHWAANVVKSDTIVLLRKTM